MSEYEELVELGFEGLDKFADKYHDKFADGVAHGFGNVKRRYSKHGKDQQRGRDNDPPPQSGIPRTRSEPPEVRRDLDSYDSEAEREREYDYAPRRREARRDRAFEGEPPRKRDDNVRERRRESDVIGYQYAQPRTSDPRYDPRSSDPMIQYGAYPYITASQQIPPVAPPPPTQAPYAYAQAGLPPPVPEDSLDQARRRSSPRKTQNRALSPSSSSDTRPCRSRNFSRSPPPCSRRRSRKRSKSPVGKGFASSVVGALAGGLAGNEVGRGDTLTTVAAAVIGAVGAREAEKKWEERNEKRARERRGDWARERDRRRERY